MSKLARTLMLCATLAAMSVPAATASAQEDAAPGDAVELFRAGERAIQEDTAPGDAVELFRAGERAVQEGRGNAGPTPAQATQPARPAGPSRPLGLFVALGVLAAALATVAARHATRRVRPHQAV